MKTQRPIAPQEEHRVLQFRPRGSAHAAGRQGLSAGQALQKQALQKEVEQEPNDLARYERDRDEPDDFRHRMLANIAAFAFTVALMAVGLWLAASIADLRTAQDCAAMGRHDCARISSPHF